MTASAYPSRRQLDDQRAGNQADDNQQRAVVQHGVAPGLQTSCAASGNGVGSAFGKAWEAEIRHPKENTESLGVAQGSWEYRV